MEKTIEIKGNWEHACETIKKGWLLPCYKCNRLTGRIIKSKQFQISACERCVCFKILKDPYLSREFVKLLLTYHKDGLNIDCL
jgi:hypothetical protein